MADELDVQIIVAELAAGKNPKVPDTRRWRTGCTVEQLVADAAERLLSVKERVLLSALMDLQSSDGRLRSSARAAIIAMENQNAEDERLERKIAMSPAGRFQAGCDDDVVRVYLPDNGRGPSVYDDDVRRKLGVEPVPEPESKEP